MLPHGGHRWKRSRPLRLPPHADFSHDHAADRVHRSDRPAPAIRRRRRHRRRASSTSRRCTRPRPSSSTSTSRCCSTDFRRSSKRAAPDDGRYRHDDLTRADREPDRGRTPQRPRPLPGAAAADLRLPERQSTAGSCSAAGSACSSSSSTARASARSRSSSSARRGDEGQDDPAGADRGDEPLLAADQILAVPAARPGDARRLSGRRR